MNNGLDTLLILLSISDLLLLASSRLGTCIRLVATQGVMLGLLPVLTNIDSLNLRIAGIAAGMLVLKGIVFPRLLYRALREAAVRREVEPFVDYRVSILSGTLALVFSFWMGARMPLPGHAASSFVVPVALLTILCGLFLIISRRKALSQILGYLVLENGIYAFGVALEHETPLVVELGIFLDLFVAIFIMGIMVFHINREFDHIDTDRLSSLKDWIQSHSPAARSAGESLSEEVHP